VDLDAVEAKQLHDAQLLKAGADAAEYKAQFDKVLAVPALLYALPAAVCLGCT